MISVAVKTNGIVTDRPKLRRIVYKTQEGKEDVYTTNNFTLPAAKISTIYESRWMIELLFKQIKQNFPLRYFWDESPNAIKMQVFIAQLLMVVIRKKGCQTRTKHGERRTMPPSLLQHNQSWGATPYFETTVF